MPIKARIDMLSTGIRTPVGVKVFGKGLETLEKVAQAVEAAVRKVPGASSAYAERVAGGMASSTVLTLAVIPALYARVKQWALRRSAKSAPAQALATVSDL